jgi:hypothetical protein
MADASSTPTKRRRDRVEKLTAQGMNRELVAAQTGVSIAKLRTDYAIELDAGRAVAKAARADDEAISKSDYFLLDAIHTAFSSPFHTERGNLLYLGSDGKGARTVADAFAYRKSRPGQFSTSGITKQMTPEKITKYAEIVRNYHKQKLETEDLR